MNDKFAKIVLILSLGITLSSPAQSPEEAKKILQSRGINYDVDNFKRLIQGHKSETVNLFIEAGMDVNAKDKEDTTVLMDASSRGYIEIVQALLAKNANVNARNREGKT